MGFISPDTRNVELGISDHMLVCASDQRPKAAPEDTERTHLFNQRDFISDLEEALWSVCFAFDDPDDCDWAWSNIFNGICNRRAPYKEVKTRSQSLPWITS